MPFTTNRLDIARHRLPGESLEAAARRERYAYLRRCRVACGADWIAVAHHRDDQIETILLRLLFGSRLIGFGGMAPVFDDVLRPFLDIERATVRQVLSDNELPTVHDPGNDDLDRPRNLIRRRLLSRLREEPGFSSESLLRTAAVARGATFQILDQLAQILDVGGELEGGGASLSLPSFRSLPPALRPFALDALRRAAGVVYAAPAAARQELERQLSTSSTAGCDCGRGWRWQSRGERLWLERAARREVVDFSYTLRVPGEISIPELGLVLRMVESEPAPWMYRGSKSRAAMSLPLKVGEQVLIRNRKPGDRLRPFGCSYRRKLKDVLIDHRVERRSRDELPLLIVGDRIAWVPGITIDDDFRLDGSASTWVAELVPSTPARH